MNLTLTLIKTIGSPLTAPDDDISGEACESLELYDLAVNNKVPMLYLEALKKRGKLALLQPQYDTESARCANFIAATAKVSKILSAARVEHAIFKSIKPYPGRGGDVDILVFDPKAQYRRAVTALVKANYVSVQPQFRELRPPSDDAELERFVKHLTTPTYGRYGHISPTGTDLLDLEHGAIQIDLQKDVAVSHVIYLDKNKLQRFASRTTLPDGTLVETLDQEAELVTVIAHSFAEQMYLLGEYYSFLYYLSAMDESGGRRFIDCCNQNKITGAAGVFAAFTAQLHKAAHGTVPEKLASIVGKLEADMEGHLDQDDLAVPKRYKKSTVAGFFWEKLRDTRSRNSVAVQMIHMLDPRLSWQVVRVLMDMRARETYIKS